MGEFRAADGVGVARTGGVGIIGRDRIDGYGSSSIEDISEELEGLMVVVERGWGRKVEVGGVGGVGGCGG